MQSAVEPHHKVYDRTTIRFHWAVALLVTILWLMGRTTVLLPRGPVRVDIWSVHVLFGFTFACLLLSRIAWRATGGRRLPPADTGVTHLVAVATHKLLYLLLLAVATLGVVNVFAHGFPLFNQWDFPKLGGGGLAGEVNFWHGLVANIIAAVVLLHAAAALFHHYVIKDAILRRMWPGIRTRRE